MYVLTKNIASISQFLATLELMGIKRKLEIIEKKNIKINLNDIKHFDITEFKVFINGLASKKSKSDIKKARKQGIKGLKEGKDYIQLNLPTNPKEPTFAYIPLTYEASLTIANIKFGGVEGKWCTAWTKNDEHWVNLVQKGQRGIVVYLTSFLHSVHNVQKMAIHFTSKGDRYTIWDANDNSQTDRYLQERLGVSEKDITKLFTWKKIRDLIVPEGEADETWEEAFKRAFINAHYQDAIQIFCEDNNFNSLSLEDRESSYYVDGQGFTIDGTDYVAMDNQDLDNAFNEWFANYGWDMAHEYFSDYEFDEDEFINEEWFREWYLKYIEEHIIPNLQGESSKRYGNKFLEKCILFQLISRKDFEEDDDRNLIYQYNENDLIIDFILKYMERQKQGKGYIQGYAEIMGEETFLELMKNNQDELFYYDAWVEDYKNGFDTYSRAESVFYQGWDEYDNHYIGEL